ncbi:MAG: SMC-Scp complex subunit ScpB [Candidatus Porifericomitaceae bacterium WSBS_2022_MAG_OTU9]
MSELTEQQIHYRNTIEAAFMASRQPLTVKQLKKMFREEEPALEKEQILSLLEIMKEEYSERGVELVELASGWQLQVGSRYSSKLLNLWQEKPPRLSRALLETLAIIAYRQPVTRGEIEEIRGVQLSQGTMHTLFERDWICVVGHRDVPGRPELLATTKSFLDYFQLRRLEDLPPAPNIGSGDDADLDLFANASESNSSNSEIQAGEIATADGVEQEHEQVKGESEPKTDTETV